MATEIDIARVEAMTCYRFYDSRLLVKALQAPIKMQDKETGKILYMDDGNRRLAQLGHKALDLALTDMWYSAGTDRESIQNTIESLGKNEFLANVAKRRGLDTCIVCCERQGDANPSSKTLKLGVTALIGAIWIDSGKNLDTVHQVMRQLRIVTPPSTWNLVESLQTEQERTSST